MKILWMDTGPLLELTVLELRVASRATYDRLVGLVQTLTNRARELEFLDRVSQFGEIRYSSGTLVELDRLARAKFAKNSDEPMQAFWRAFDFAVPSRLARPLVGEPLERAAFLEEDIVQFGPVDAHLLAVVQASGDCQLVTIDRALRGIAGARSRGRAFFPV